jgi:hypothetical protein
MQISTRGGEKLEVVWWKDKAHPGWALLKPLVYAAAIALILKSTASNFDAGEMKAVVATFITAIMAEGFGIKKG